MPETKNNNKAWYLRKEVWGAAMTTASSLLMLFPQQTAAYKVGAGIGIALGGITTIAGLKKGYQADNLFPGITKAMDAVPDSLTGTRGSKIK